jgi:thiol-disulfide isomerase/thioredoxin
LDFALCTGKTLANGLQKDTLQDECFALAENLLQLGRERLFSVENRQPYQSEQMYLFDAKRISQFLNSIYGAYLLKREQYDSAAVYTGIAARYFEWKDTRFNERYFTALEKILPAAEMVEAMKPAFANGGYNDSMRDRFLELYKATGKTDMDEVMAFLRQVRMTALEEELAAKIISVPAPDFQVTGLNGESVSRESPKGKVVFIDFWATWCRPCIAGFPAMQKFVDANKDRDDLAMLFVNTMQGGNDEPSVVRKFFEDKPFTFDVLLDPEDKASKGFNVRGLPTKVVMDKNGIIRFVLLGTGDDEQKAVDELQAMINVAANNNYVIKSSNYEIFFCCFPVSDHDLVSGPGSEHSVLRPAEGRFEKLPG